MDDFTHNYCMNGRLVRNKLNILNNTRLGRFTVVTGARQVGKSTLVQMTFPDTPILRFDSMAERAAYQELTPADWISRYRTVILDEVQKAPQIFDTLKSCFDQDSDLRYVLLGSSQVMFMQGVRETLAGRVALLKLYSFTLPELMDRGEVEPQSRFIELLATPHQATSILDAMLDPVIALSDREAIAKHWFDYLLRWGGMPALLDPQMNNQNRMDWLRDYQELYLQRDLGDLARLSDLEPFARTQKIAALRTGELVQFAALGAQAGVAANTAKRYLQYLELSYQIILLQPWFRNTEKRLSKMPKLHFLDNGVRRGILRRTGEVDGHEFESTLVAETIKQANFVNPGAEFSHLRTSDGREVDLLMELENGYYAFEFKLSEHTVDGDARHLRDLSSILDKPLLAGFVLSRDPKARRLSNGLVGEPIYAIPSWRFFG